MHSNTTCNGDHRIIRLGESHEDGQVYADLAAITDGGKAVCLAAKDDVAGHALVYLTDAEAIELAEQLLCAVGLARIARAVAEVTK